VLFRSAEFGKHSHTEFVNPDLVSLGQAFGAHSERVGRADELRPALRRAFSVADRPSVIVVPVDYGENMKLTKLFGEMLPH
jgi:acetolactate synthase-1/2/3 large subunit